MSQYLTGKNVVIAILASILIGWAGYAGYSAYAQKIAPADPLAPELVLNKDKFNIGDQILIKVKHNRPLSKYSVSWQVLDGYDIKTDYVSCMVDGIIMGTGATPKTLLVLCSVNYIENGEIVSYFLSSQIKIGNGPQPPPPPDPKPPIPPPDPNPEPTDAFYKSLKAGWMLENTNDKVFKNDLASIYSESIKIVQTDKTLTTAKQMFDRMHAARIFLIKESLPNTRAAITIYLDSVLPRSVSAPLDDETRNLLALHFDKVSKYLQRLP